jgi:hypothetical protein
MLWPTQAEADHFYGNPRGADPAHPSAAWESKNLVRIEPPFQMTYAGRPIKTIKIHRLCADSLARVLSDIAHAASHMPNVLSQWGVTIFGGTYNYRLMRGGNRLSMHSYGCAIDLDPERNSMGDRTPHFASCPEVLEAFRKEGWVWLGPTSAHDGMHFQAARL